MKELLLENILFQITIKRKLINSIRLRILANNQISISAPHLVPDQVIKKFIIDHQSWIIRQYFKIGQTIRFSEHKSISILGVNYKFNISPSNRDSLVIFDDQKIIHLHTSTQSEARIKKIFESRLKIYALNLIKQELRSYQSKYHFSFNRLTVRNQSSRFGSCSSSGNLNFNWQIIFFPPDKFKHIILHEVAHLTHHNHSSSFWKLLASYDLEWRMNRLWLKKEGSKHFLIHKS